MLDADDLAGEPVFITLTNLESVPEVQEDPQAAKKKEKLQQGVFYNVPARMAIKVHSLQKDWARMETPMGQFGRVEILSNTLVDKKNTIQVTFFQQTGGTKDIME